MTLTGKQKAWDAAKTARRLEVEPKDRGVAVTIAERRKITLRRCVCTHAWKHHSWSGRCQRGCDCTLGTRRARR